VNIESSVTQTAFGNVREDSSSSQSLDDPSYGWTENPTQLSNWLWLSMSPLDKSILVVFDQLPYKLPTQELIALHGSSKKWADFNGT